MNKFIAIFFILLTALLIGFVVFTGSEDVSLSTTAEKGFMNITNIEFEEGKQIVPIHGEWEFYKKQLRMPENFQQDNIHPAYIQVPSSWNEETFDDRSKYGFGTYRMILQIPSKDIGKNKALFIQSIGSAYRLWIGGHEKIGLGKVGTSLEEEKRKEHMNLIFFQPQQQFIEIIIQASNYSIREGGINREILYGDTDALIPYILKDLITDLFIISGFFMIGLYHLIVFGFRKNDISTLFVGLGSIGISSRTLFMNGYLSSILFRDEYWELVVKLEYISELVVFLSLVFLMHRLYPKEVHRFMILVSVALSIGLFLYIAITPARVFTETMLLQSVLKVVVLLYFVFFVGILAYVRKREGAFIHLIALVIVSISILNDTLYYLRMIDTIELLNFSAALFIMAQAIIVSYRYSQISNRNNMLLRELESTNETLEQKVIKRTQSLNEANQRLIEMKENRSEMLVNIAHDLGSPLVSIQTYLQLLVERKVPSNREDLTKQLIDTTVYMKRLIQDLFELSKLESKRMIFYFEKLTIQQWLQDVHSKFFAELSQKNFTLELGRVETTINEEEGLIQIDRFRMLQVLQNYIDNAMKFSRGISNRITLNSYIQFNESYGQYELVVEVEDAGIGMTEEEQKYVFHRFYKSRERNEEGSGLGLAIVKEIVKQHHGDVGVRSEKGKGSTFYFTLPLTL